MIDYCHQCIEQTSGNYFPYNLLLNVVCLLILIRKREDKTVIVNCLI